MFCQKCGAPMDHDAAFCQHCGTPVVAASSAAPTAQYAPNQFAPQATENAPVSNYQQPPVYPYNSNPGYAPAPAKAPMNPAKKKKIILFSAIGGAAVILTVVLVLILIGNAAGFSSPTDAAEAFVVAYGNRDIEAYVDCVPDFIVREMAADFGLNANASKSDIVKIGQLRTPSVDKNIHIIGSFIEEYKRPEDYRRLNNSYYDYLYPYERAQITEVVIVEVTAMYNGNYDSVEVVCIKMDGRWYAIDMD